MDDILVTLCDWQVDCMFKQRYRMMYMIVWEKQVRSAAYVIKQNV